MNDWVTEAALYVGLPVVVPGADAVIVHGPIAVGLPLVVPFVVQFPDAVKLTVWPPTLEDAFNENGLPYCTPCNCVKVIVCDIVLEPAGRIVNVPDTALAAS